MRDVESRVIWTVGSVGSWSGEENNDRQSSSS
jgi:hypothetical protein